VKLLSLTTTNFKKLGNQDFWFTDGLNVIVGDNARGKSTLLQAIEAALFGITVVPGKKENVPTWGQSTFSLGLHFTVAPAVYVLTRTKSTAKLVRIDEGNEELLANGNTPVTAYIEELLGITAKDYNLFVQSKQGETSGILTFGGAALSRKVEEFAGVDVIDKVQAAASDRAKFAARDVEMNTVSAEQLAAISDVVNQLEGEHFNAGEVLAEAEAAQARLEPLAVAYPSPSSEELSKARRAADRLLRERSAAQANVDTLKSQLAELQAEEVEEPGDVEAQREHLAELKRKAQDAQENLNTLRGKFGEALRLGDAVVNAEDAAEEAQRNLDEILAGRTREEIEERISSLESGRRAALDLVSIDRSEMAALKSMADGAACPTCGTQLTDHDPEKLAAEIAEKEKSVAANTQEAKGIEADVAALREELKRLDKGEDALRRHTAAKLANEAKLEELPGLDTLQKDLAAATQALESLAPEVEKLQGSVATSEQVAAVYQKHQTKLSSAAKKLARAEDALADLPEAPTPPTDVEIDTAAQLEAEARRLESEHAALARSLQKAVDDAGFALADAAAKLNDAQRREAELKGRQSAAQAAAADHDRAKRLGRFLGDRRNTYLKEVWQAVLAAASRQVATSSSGLIQRIDYRDGDFLFTEDGIEAPVTSASGAQKAHIGVAIRIGLSRALYGSDSLLIFDEPTESMSERHAVGLSSSLAGSAKQVLLITHREQDQALATNIIEL
jgi:DNA repair exonuclease SbcCD ATPase subunit